MLDKINFLKKILDIEPENVQVLIELGWMYADDLHEPELAFSTLNKALAIEPNSVDALFWISKVHFYNDYDIEKTMKYLEKALEIFPGHPPSASLYGSVCCDAEKPELAIKHIELAIKKESSWICLYAVLNLIYTQLDDIPKATQYALKAYELAKQMISVSTTDNYSDYEACVTQRWLSQDSLDHLKHCASRQ